MRETVPCQICGRELTDHSTVTNHAFNRFSAPPASSPAHSPPGPSGIDWSAVGLWTRIYKLIVEWRAEPDTRRTLCGKTLECLRPNQHDGECWPKEGEGI